MERRRYVDGFLFVGVAYVVAISCLLFEPWLLFPGLVVYVILIALLLGHGFHRLYTSDQQVSLVAAVSIVASAFVSWLNYNRHDTAAPGVLRSPCGSALLRQGQFFAVGFVIALAVLPLASYFPIGAHLFGPDPWLKAAMTPWPWEEMFQKAIGSPQSTAPAAAPPGWLDDAYLQQFPAGQRAGVLQALTELGAQEHRSSESVERLTASPEASLVVSVRGAVAPDARFIASLLFSIMACLLAPPLTLFSLCFALGARTLAHFHATLENGPDGTSALYHRDDPGSPWATHVLRLSNSRFETFDQQGRRTRERDLLLVGFNAFNDYPILLEEGVLAEHAHILGDSGSGKSSLGIAPLMAQLIGRPNTSVVILDLKGDRALFEAARFGVRDANARPRNGGGKPKRLRFRWFTNRSRHSTFAFNPFLQEHIQQVSVQQRASILLQSLGLEYGEGYGQSYYSAVHRSILTKVLRDDPAICSFRRLQHYFDRDLRTRLRDMNIDRKTYQDASHLFTVIDSLAAFDALNVTPESDVGESVLRHQIDMSQVVKKPYVVYYYLPSALEEQSVSEIAKLALHSLLTAAVVRGPSKHRVYLFIDEFQQVVSADLEIVLRQARSHGISVILANHTMEDLRTSDANLIPTVQTNTRFKQVFAASDLDQQDAVIAGSGETIFTLKSRTVNAAGGESVGWNENIGARLRRNDIIETTDSMLMCLMHVTRGQGLTQFGGLMFQAVTPYHITAEEYDRRSAAHWPEPGQGTLIAAPDTSVADAHEVERQAADQQRLLSGIEKRLEDFDS